MKDCPNNDDELGCSENKPLLFNCGVNDEFILLNRVCDFSIDCSNSEDEIFCSNSYKYLFFTILNSIHWFYEKINSDRKGRMWAYGEEMWKWTMYKGR